MDPRCRPGIRAAYLRGPPPGDGASTPPSSPVRHRPERPSSSSTVHTRR
jgi:hypothetical protein